eukprot:1844490-Lingulodinium_polyedra.AAC.1
MVRVLVTPVTESHWQHASEARDPESVVAYYLGAAQADFLPVLRRTCDPLTDMELLGYIGFSTEFQRFADAPASAVEPVLELEDTLARQAWSLVVALLRA